MENKTPTITYDITWEELEEQRLANEEKERMKNFTPRIKKYV